MSFLSLFAAVALAKKPPEPHWTDPKWFARPILGGGAVTVGGSTYGQVTGGASAGFRTRYKGGAVPWADLTRLQATATYGIGSDSLGGDLRVGSFVGPDWKILALQFGPDVFYNGYGTLASPDYHLPWAPGLALVSAARLRVVPKVLVLNGDLVPSWVASPDRQSGLVDPFSELTTGAWATLTAGPIGLTLGVRHNWSAAGEYTSYSVGVAL